MFSKFDSEKHNQLVRDRNKERARNIIPRVLAALDCTGDLELSTYNPISTADWIFATDHKLMTTAAVVFRKLAPLEELTVPVKGKMA